MTRYHQLYDLLMGFAMRLTKNRTDAEDLMQETICRAYKNKHRYQPGTNFKAWMTTIMRNSYINLYRKRKTRNTTSEPVETFAYSLESTGPDALAENRVQHSELVDIVHSLSDTYRVAFLMSYQGYQYNEIAEKLQIPMGTVKSRINYARKLLKEKIEATYAMPQQVQKVAAA
ncbi:MAG: sigma-70 family RNA polymerase sigma factor [Bacteroidota bacterium]